ncbi:MAG: RHS repeat-associated core domain-containing protein [Acidobacteriaceae bacterium]
MKFGCPILSAAKRGNQLPRRSFKYGNGIPQNFYHTGRGLLYKGFGNNIFNYNMTFTGDGNIVHKDVGLNSSTTNEHWDYAFDEFNRIAGANQTNAAQVLHNLTFKYDQYGNRWQQNITSGTGTTVNYAFDLSTNHVQNANYSYDALGNVTNDGFHTYTYDAENRMTQVDSGTTGKYTYDAFSRRVRVDAGAASRECVFDLGGNCIAEMNVASGAWLKSDIRALGQTIATYTGAGGTTYFNHVDQIGSLRAQSTVSATVKTTCTYDPFGSTFNCSNGLTTTDAFTGDEHDTESGLEHTQFRQLNALAARWMSPDPYAGSADITNPQSLNRYAYVLNSPLTATDPLGLFQAVDRCGYDACVTADSWGWASLSNLFFGFWGGGWGGGFTGGGGGGGKGNPKPKPTPTPKPPVTCHSLAAGQVPSGSLTSWASGVGTAASMTSEWGLGIGPTNTTFGPNSVQSQEMMGAYGLAGSVNAFLSGGRSSGHQDFGLGGLGSTGLNPTGQFVGSYDYSMLLSSGKLNITITNTTTMWSALYHAPGLNPNPPTRTGWSPGGRVNQTFQITVPCP